MDGIFGIGPLELFFVAIIALIVLGPERLPGVLREIAKTIRRVREVTNEFTSQFGDELKALDEINPRKILADMTDPTKPLPGDKPADASSTAQTVNKPVATPKPPAPKAQVTANAILSSKAATEAARATKAAKEAEAAKAADEKTAVNGAPEITDTSDISDNRIMPPVADVSATVHADETPTAASPHVPSAELHDEEIVSSVPSEELPQIDQEPGDHSLHAAALDPEPLPLDERA